MSEAVGIHAHPTFKLGRRPPKNAPALKAENFLKTGALPSYPSADVIQALGWPMDLNDQDGDCVVAALDHALQAIYTLLGVPRTNWTNDEIVAYYKTQNPSFEQNGDPNVNGPGSSADGGMDIQTFLEYLVAQKVILGFAKIDQTNEAAVKAGIFIGIGTVTGQDMTVAQQNQPDVWDFVPNQADWGGHATAWVGYLGSPDQDQTVSWGRIYEMTQAFIQHQVSEDWFILTQAHVDHPGFRDAFDLPGFAQAYTEITGNPFPVPVGPAPVPPTPTPAPSPPPIPPPPSPTPTPVPTPPVPSPFPPAPVPEPGDNPWTFIQRVWRWLMDDVLPLLVVKKSK